MALSKDKPGTVVQHHVLALTGATRGVLKAQPMQSLDVHMHQPAGLSVFVARSGRWQRFQWWQLVDSQADQDLIRGRGRYAQALAYLPRAHPVGLAQLAHLLLKLRRAFAWLA